MVRAEEFVWTEFESISSFRSSLLFLKLERKYWTQQCSLIHLFQKPLIKMDVLPSLNFVIFKKGGIAKTDASDFIKRENLKQT